MLPSHDRNRGSYKRMSGFEKRKSLMGEGGLLLPLFFGEAVWRTRLRVRRDLELTYTFKWFTYNEFEPVLVYDMQPPALQKWPLFSIIFFWKCLESKKRGFPKINSIFNISKKKSYRHLNFFIFSFNFKYIFFQIR